MALSLVCSEYVDIFGTAFYHSYTFENLSWGVLHKSVLDRYDNPSAWLKTKILERRRYFFGKPYVCNKII